MSLSKHNKQFYLFNIGVLFAFLLYLTLFSLPYPLGNDLNSNAEIINISTDMHDSFHYNDYHITPAILPEEKTITVNDIKIINRSFRDSQRFFFSDLYCIPLLLIRSKLSVPAFLCSFRKTSKKASVISIPIGGHAPPCIIYL